MPLRLVAAEEEEKKKPGGLRLVPAEPEVQEQPQQQVGPSWGDVAMSFPKAAVGAAETAGTLATGMLVGFPLGGLVQLGTLAVTGDVDAAVKAGGKVSDFVTYKPLSEYGKIYTNLAGKVIELPAKIVRSYGEVLMSKDELEDTYHELGLPVVSQLSPGMTTAVTTPLELALYGLAFKPLHGAVEGRARTKNFMRDATAEDWAIAERLIKQDKPEELKSYLIKREAEVYKTPPPRKLNIYPATEPYRETTISPQIRDTRKFEIVRERGEAPEVSAMGMPLTRRETEVGYQAPRPKKLITIPAEKPKIELTEAQKLKRSQLAWKQTIAAEGSKTKITPERLTDTISKYEVDSEYARYGALNIAERLETEAAGLGPENAGKTLYAAKLLREYADSGRKEGPRGGGRWVFERYGKEIADYAMELETGIDGATLDFLGLQSLYQRAATPSVKDAIVRFGRKFKEFWVPFSTMPEGGKALGLRYKAMGDIARAERFVDRIHEKLDRFPDDVKADFFRYMDGQIGVEMLPESAQTLARSYRNASDRIGQMLVKRGILKEEQYNKYKGKYVHYMYAKHVLGEDKPVGISPTGKLNLSYAKSRKDLTLEQRKAIGLIEDASVAVPVGMGKALSDIGKHDYMAAVSRNPEWTWQPSMVELGEGRRIGIGKLVEEVKTYEKMVRLGAGEEVQAKYNQLNTALQQAMEQTQNIPRDFEQLPNTKSYGPLAGAYVRKPIADDLKPLMGAMTDRGKLFQTLVDIESQAVALFKMGKVALNIPTAVRNIASNILQQNMRGRPLYSIPGDMVNGATSMLKKDVYYEESFRQGMFKTNWAATEINEILNIFSRVETGNWNSFLNAVKKVAKYYGRIDDIAKLSIYRQMREAGHNITDSTLEAMKWGMDYSLASRSVKGLRQHIMPFLSYQYKVAPLIAESLKNRPWVIGKYAAIPTLAIAAVKEMYDMTDKDWQKLKKDLPHYIKRSGTYMIMPLKSPEGNWQWVNLEYFFPWGNYLQLFRDIEQKDMGEVARDLGVSNPFMDIFRMFASAKEDQPPVHPYYGTPIYNRLDPAYVKAAKVMEFMAYTWAPQMLSRRGALGYTEGAISGEKDKWGRTITPAQAIGRWFGINIVAVSPRQTKVIKGAKAKELRKDFYRIKADPTKTKEEKREARKRLREELRKLRYE